MNLNKAWVNFHNGDPITDSELIGMIAQAESALEYLNARGERFFLATSKTYQDLETLRNYRFARGLL